MYQKRNASPFSRSIATLNSIICHHRRVCTGRHLCLLQGADENVFPVQELIKLLGRVVAPAVDIKLDYANHVHQRLLAIIVGNWAERWHRVRSRRW